MTKLTKIKIGNLTYQVKHLVDSEETHFGKSSEKEQWIRMSKNFASEDKYWETLFHEIVHQLLDQASFHDVGKDEKLIDCLASGLYQVLKENKLLK